MPRADWKDIVIRKTLFEEASVIAERRHFPNVSQYVADALRRAIAEDTELLIRSEVSHG